MDFLLFASDPSLVKKLKSAAPHLSPIDSLDSYNGKGECLILYKQEMSALDPLIQKNPEGIFVSIDPSNWDEEKEWGALVYYLPQIPNDDELKLLFKLLEQDEKPSDEDPELKALFQGYRGQILMRVQKLRFLLEALLMEKSEENWEKFRMAVHKLAGNAGSYGFDAVSVQCKAMESAILNERASLDEEKLRNFLRAVCTHYWEKTKIALEGGEEESSPTGEECDLFLVDDDRDFLEFVKVAAKKRKLHIATESNFQNARKKLQDPTFQPKVLLLDIYTDEENISGFDLLETIQKEHRKSSSLLGIISARGEIPDRLKAYSYGVDLFFQKPIQVDELIDQVKKFSTFSSEGEKSVFLIDDDASFCQMVTAGMDQKNTHLQTFTEVNPFIEALQRNPPDLILLDIQLPQYSGIELLHVIHSDFRFRSLPIVIITAREDAELLRDAIAAGAVDYLIKPLQPEQVNHYVQNFFRKRHYLEVFFEKDFSTGLYSERTIADFFYTYSLRYKQFCFVQFYIHYASNTPLEVRRREREKLGKILIDYFSENDVVGLWQNELVLLLVDFSLEQAYFLLQRFLDRLGRDFAERWDSKLPIEISIALFPHEGGSVEDLFSVTSHRIQREGKNGIHYDENLTKIQMKREKLEKRRGILLVCEDPLFFDTLSYAIELHAMGVTALKSLQEGYEWLLDHFPHESPSLILLDLFVAEEKGWVMIEKIAQTVGKRVPIIVLASQVRERDIAEAARIGISLYLPKPLSVQVLMEIIEQVI